MSRPLFIAGDWGTSHLRLYLCGEAGIIDRKAGPGAVGADEPHEAILFSRIQPWIDRHGPLPVLLCGMVGSRNGWVEAPYAPCPAGAADLRRLAIELEIRGLKIAIVPGVSGQNPRGAPDVMRGEEAQIVGAVRLAPELGQGRRLVYHPGTHAKWALIEDGRIIGFQTAMTGELFALLREHSTLNKVGARAATPGDGFALGLQRAEETAEAGLLHALFEVRSRQLIDGWDAAFAMDFLSGLLIGADVGGAMAQFGRDIGDVVLVGDPALATRYGQALARRGVAMRTLSGEDCALAGLAAIFETGKDAPHVAC